MRRHDPNLFPGKFVTCVFNPDRALCLRPRAAQNGPPLDDNVAVTPANQAAWHAHLARIDQALESAEVLAPDLRHRLQQQREQIIRFLAENNHPRGESA
jgi:hypothetical protein